MDPNFEADEELEEEFEDEQWMEVNSEDEGEEGQEEEEEDEEDSISQSTPSKRKRPAAADDENDDDDNDGEDDEEEEEEADESIEILESEEDGMNEGGGQPAAGVRRKITMNKRRKKRKENQQQQQHGSHESGGSSGNGPPEEENAGNVQEEGEREEIVLDGKSREEEEDVGELDDEQLLERPKRRDRSQMNPLAFDPYAVLPLNRQVSREVVQRAVEYMQLYMLRHQFQFIAFDLLRRMFQNALLFGAPISKIRLPQPSYISMYALSRLHIPAVLVRPINLRAFFEAMDRLELLVGHKLWERFFFSGGHFHNPRNGNGKNILPNVGHFSICNPSTTGEATFFRTQILNILRPLHRAVLRRDWATAAESIATIALRPPRQHHAHVNFEFFSRTMGPFLPAIHSTAQQCLLEARPPIDLLCRQMTALFTAFMPTASKKVFWRDNGSIYYTRLLLFHLVNLRLEHRPGEQNTLNIARQAVTLQGSAERHRVCVLLHYCVDVERQLMQLRKTRRRDKRASVFGEDKIEDRSLISSFPNFLATLFEDHRDLGTLLPLAVWGAVQFDSMEELTDKLLEACTDYPYLLVHAYNVLARFQLENVAGQLLAQLFNLSIDLLPTTTFALDLIEQRSLDPTNYGTFDEIISGNLRVLFPFLDLGRNRTDERAWGLLHSNLDYIWKNEDLVGAFVQPQWQKRHSWWPKFHDKIRVPLPRRAAKMRKRCFRLLNKIHV